MKQVIIGVDPHKLSATIEVVDDREQLLGEGRFTTDHAGYGAMGTYVKGWPDRVWAIEGATGTGLPLAQRLLEALRMLTDRRETLTRRLQTVNRLQRHLAELLPGTAKRDITATQAKAMLATVRPCGRVTSLGRPVVGSQPRSSPT